MGDGGQGWWRLLVVTSAAATTGSGTAGLATWETVSQQAGNHEPHHPSVRYSHTASMVDNKMIISHGYYYGHDGSGPQWLSDTWAFDVEKARWEALVSPASHVAKPHGRMSHSAVATGGRLILYGGDDGGHRDDSTRGYQSSHLSDLWVLGVTAGQWADGWSELHPRNPPPPRAHHSAVLLYGGSQMFVFGGVRKGDLWVYNVEENGWIQVPQSADVGAARHPGKRHGHAVTADEHDTGFYLFGGFAFADDVAEHGGEHGPLADLWHYGGAAGRWTQLLETHPRGGRTYASLLHHGSGLFLFAGANCKGSCKCFGDLWRYPTDGHPMVAATWSPQTVRKEPISRYKQTAVAYNGKLHTFGGESYEPYMYHNSVSRINLEDASGGLSLTSSDAAMLAVAVMGLIVVAIALRHTIVAHRQVQFKAR